MIFTKITLVHFGTVSQKTGLKIMLFVVNCVLKYFSFLTQGILMIFAWIVFAPSNEMHIRSMWIVKTISMKMDDFQIHCYRNFHQYLFSHNRTIYLNFVASVQEFVRKFIRAKICTNKGRTQHKHDKEYIGEVQSVQRKMLLEIIMQTIVSAVNRVRILGFVLEI